MTLFLKLCSVTLLLSLQGVADTGTTTKPIRIVAFGDSTTATRGSLKIYCDQLRGLCDEAGRNVDIINSGVGGNHTDLAMKRFDRDVLQHDPGIVIIQFGINDAAVDVWKNPPATQPRVNLERYAKNLREFVQQLQARKIRVILMTPNPLRWTERLKQLYGKPPYRPDDVDGFNVLLSQYSAATRQVAHSEKVTLIDVDEAFRKFADQSGQSMDDLVLDGMHPNEKGHTLIANLIFKELSQKRE